jgi:hypothetical protein
MSPAATVVDRPKHPELATPLPGGVYVPTSQTCPTCGGTDPIVQGVFQHRCVLTFAG